MSTEFQTKVGKHYLLSSVSTSWVTGPTMLNLLQPGEAIHKAEYEHTSRDLYLTVPDAASDVLAIRIHKAMDSGNMCVNVVAKNPQEFLAKMRRINPAAEYETHYRIPCNSEAGKLVLSHASAMGFEFEPDIVTQYMTPEEKRLLQEGHERPVDITPYLDPECKGFSKEHIPALREQKLFSQQPELNNFLCDIIEKTARGKAINLEEMDKKLGHYAAALRPGPDSLGHDKK